MRFKLLTVDELIQQAKERPSRVRRDGDCIVFDGWYDIPLKDCNTHRKVVAWIAHLSEKSWVTPEMIGRFIEKTVGREQTP